MTDPAAVPDPAAVRDPAAVDDLDAPDAHTLPGLPVAGGADTDADGRADTVAVLDGPDLLLHTDLDGDGLVDEVLRLGAGVLPGLADAPDEGGYGGGGDGDGWWSWLPWFSGGDGSFR
ncbi:hypothetical protein Psed_6632 [Pseudonocardia dioxanivorans CB1190]|uniref:Uncharacterized protein n=1 Tax=Pseudonocardia dioxanivorans (strain ATCC 55486 / DSM 44775 / JCM 13855 / CB1190) TaxID=675635 RepID=F4CXR4_PSEUX|nr:hypothetical protein [Pseudonocardia dioxanivorans]AEA28720.1 hypothetical protein Psed_6632 [Pseudonocardia dioxanivorans CB1190]